MSPVNLMNRGLDDIKGGKMATKCECGLTYVPGHPEDEIQHEQWHTEYFYGPEITAVRELTSIATLNSFSVYVVDGSCPLETRLKLAQVAIVAKRSMPDYPAGYSGAVDEYDQRLYIAVDGVRIVAMIITGLEDFFWKCSWNDDGSFKFWHQQPEKRRSYKVARVWTAPSCQSKGVASQLIQIVSDQLSCNIVDLGWELPLSVPGKNLVKRFCPDLLWGCGDTITIRNYLQET